ncbi:MAG TPA: hypothetical protein VEV41_06000 [Terriglobales bacterium]|nr:hypothetical protein [Terriglobales bacterium]
MLLLKPSSQSLLSRVLLSRQIRPSLSAAGVMAVAVFMAEVEDSVVVAASIAGVFAVGQVRALTEWEVAPTAGLVRRGA